VLGDSLARSAQPQMSARHAKRRDSLCCASVGCSSICATSIDAAPFCVAPHANDLTRRTTRVLRSLRADSRIGFGWRVAGVGGAEVVTSIDRTLARVRVAANDRRFNQERVALPPSLSLASLFMTPSFGTSCTTASSSSRLPSSHLLSSRMRPTHVRSLGSGSPHVRASRVIHPVELPT
jgi:hypothetical protein